MKHQSSAHYYCRRPQGWAALPIFADDEAVNSGVFQLPLFAGTPPHELLVDIATRGCAVVVVVLHVARYVVSVRANAWAGAAAMPA